jgi:hypothetical protein
MAATARWRRRCWNKACAVCRQTISTSGKSTGSASKDPDLFIRPGGAAEALLKAKRDGKVKFLGFTGHKDPDIHLAMLNTGFPFDAV